MTLPNSDELKKVHEIIKKSKLKNKVAFIGEVVPKETNILDGWWIKTHKIENNVLPLNGEAPDTDGGEFYIPNAHFVEKHHIVNDLSLFVLSSDNYRTSDWSTQTPCTFNKIEVLSDDTNIGLAPGMLSLR